MPRLKKAAYEKAAEQLGIPVEDWVEGVVDAYTKTLFASAAIDAGVNFSDLLVSRGPEDSLEVNTLPTRRICEHAGLPSDFFEIMPEDALASVVFGFYADWKLRGGEPDHGAEALIREVDPAVN